ncbi:hypothetical protein B0T16DRAFT_458614 [Cercophora newfieldiana]|uniref:Nephrocystin 3-like N-terminal domain-containing protein n=1 Tax=Cercophora newfieldiana TaxID=92897 RepID=A0AA39Y634_9PEZI|nr:hypothetical protein B0T16DRAFT_458614 [Cercophora newfieldiana]
MPPSTALATVSSFSSTLPADLRLAQAISEFAQILDGPSKQRFRELQVQLTTASPSANDVIRLTEELNRDGAKRHASWQPATGTRVGGFLRRLQQFAASGDVLIGGSQNLIASGVWASVRAMLEASVGYHTLFDQVSTLLMKLATSWYISQEFVQHFPSSEELQLFLAEYLIRLVRLCQKVVIFSRKSPASLLAASLLSSFDTEFLPIQQELDQWGLLIEKKFSSLVAKSAIDGQIAGAKVGRSLTRLISSKAKQRTRLERQQRLLDRLAPDQECFESIWRRERKKGNATWILETSEYQAWASTESASALCITGCLGSGKTVALANIVADISLRERRCAFFFCKAEDKRTFTARTIIGSIAQQLLLGAVEECHWGVLDRNPRLSLGPLTLESILQLLPSLLPSTRNVAYRIVLDGLDECSTEEVDDILSALRALCQSLEGLVSVCFSARTNSHAAITSRSIFEGLQQVSVGNAERDDEIKSYIKAEVTRRNKLRETPLSAEIETLVADQLMLGAQGMYLWVSLQLEAIFPATLKTITTDEGVKGILLRLPKSLPEAFDQAISRITDPRYGSTIFGMIGVAVVPLSGEQLQVALSITPGDTRWNSGAMVNCSPRQLVAICGGSLIEMDEEDGHVRFIHHSVWTHLASSRGSSDALDRGWVCEMERRMGSVCINYLHFPELKSPLTVQHDSIDGRNITERVKDSVTSPQPVIGQIIRHLRNDRRRNIGPKNFDLLATLQTMHLSGDKDVFRCFFPYAEAHWFYHTRLFSMERDEHGEYSLWKKIVEERSEKVNPPWKDGIKKDSGSSNLPLLFDLVVNFDHGALFQHMVREAFNQDSTFGNLFINQLAPRIKDGTFRITGPWLDDVIALHLTVGPIELGVLQTLNSLGAGHAFRYIGHPRPDTLGRQSRLTWSVIKNVCRGPQPPGLAEEEIFQVALTVACSWEFEVVKEVSSEMMSHLLEPIRRGWLAMSHKIIFQLVVLPGPLTEIFDNLQPLQAAIESGNAEISVI